MTDTDYIWPGRPMAFTYAVTGDDATSFSGEVRLNHHVIWQTTVHIGAVDPWPNLERLHEMLAEAFATHLAEVLARPAAPEFATTNEPASHPERGSRYTP